MARWLLTFLSVACMLFSTPTVWAQKKEKEKQDQEITLERLFPKDSFFGPAPAARHSRPTASMPPGYIAVMTNVVMETICGFTNSRPIR